MAGRQAMAGRGGRRLVRLLDRALQQGQDVVGQHGGGKAEQRYAGMAEAAQLAVQHAFQAPEHALDLPARAVEFGDALCADRLGQVAPQPQGGVAILGRLVQRKLDASPRYLLMLCRDHLLAHQPGLDPPARAPLPLLSQAGMGGVLAHDEAGARALQAPQHRAGAVVPVG